ncbi:DUF3108 domain-containing protein [Sphingomonas sp. RS6]
MIHLFLLALAQVAAPAVVPDGTRLQAGSRCYTIFNGDKAIGQTWQSVRAIKEAGVPMWDVVVHQRMAGGQFDLRDHFVLRRADLRPVTMDSRKNGQAHARVRYSDDVAETSVDGKTPTMTQLEGPVWDGNLWGLTMAALPLAEGGHFELPSYHYDKGAGRFVFDVVGSETVDGKAAWVVAAEGGDGRKVRYLIAKDPADELGYGAGPFRQSIGGDCGELAEP